MADPLSQLRQFHINGREIKEHNGYIIFGEFGWPKNVNTNYMIYSTEDDKNKKEYYTLECLLYFLKHMDLAHHHYVKQAGRDSIPVVHRPDRKGILAYLKGEQQTSTGIDKNAPIPPLRLPTAEIMARDQHSSSGFQANSNLQSSSQSSQNDAQKSLDGSDRTMATKRTHDPDMEKKLREEFASRLYEPSNKKLATIIPAEGADKTGEASESSAAITKFGPEKLAAMRAKHLAVKRTTIIDADLEVGKSGLGVTDAGNKEAELLIAMDSDPSKLIKSKEKVWRTRTTILQAQSKDFLKTLMPFISTLKDDQQPKKPASQMPTIPPETQMSMQSQTQQQQQQQLLQQQQQAIQKNAYNRYDQERFVKLDIGVEIDTKKSFVSGVTANGLPSYNQGSQPVSNARPDLPTNMPATQAPGANENRHPHHGQSQHNSSSHSNSSIKVMPSNRKKRYSDMPIIIIPATPTSLINMSNASSILQDLTYEEKTPGRGRESEILIQRRKPDGTAPFYKVMDNPSKLDLEDWNRVVAVFVQGPSWQFKGWPLGDSPVDIFARIKAFHLKWDESKLDDNVAKWNVQILELSRNKRHLDKANMLKFWSSLESYMAKHKSFLKF